MKQAASAQCLTHSRCSIVHSPPSPPHPLSNKPSAITHSSPSDWAPVMCQARARPRLQTAAKLRFICPTVKTDGASPTSSGDMAVTRQHPTLFLWGPLCLREASLKLGFPGFWVLWWGCLRGLHAGGPGISLEGTPTLYAHPRT